MSGMWPSWDEEPGGGGAERAMFNLNPIPAPDTPSTSSGQTKRYGRQPGTRSSPTSTRNLATEEQPAADGDSNPKPGPGRPLKAIGEAVQEIHTVFRNSLLGVCTTYGRSIEYVESLLPDPFGVIHSSRKPLIWNIWRHFFGGPDAAADGIAYRADREAAALTEEGELGWEQGLLDRFAGEKTDGLVKMHGDHARLATMLKAHLKNQDVIGQQLRTAGIHTFTCVLADSPSVGPGTGALSDLMGFRFYSKELEDYARSRIDPEDFASYAHVDLLKKLKDAHTAQLQLEDVESKALVKEATDRPLAVAAAKSKMYAFLCVTAPEIIVRKNFPWYRLGTLLRRHHLCVWNAPSHKLFPTPGHILSRNISLDHFRHLLTALNEAKAFPTDDSMMRVGRWSWSHGMSHWLAH